MSETKTKKSIGVSFAAIITAVLLIISCVTACVAINSGGSAAANAASAALDDAKKAVTDFVDDSVRLEADYYDNLFKKVNTAVVMYQGKNDNGQLENICSAVGADFILITDAKGKITQAYPDEKLVGKTLKENKMNAFGKITKGIVDKITTDPEKTDDGYKINVGMRRQDSDGVLVLGITDDSYAVVAGENLADSCGKNTIVEKEGKIISTNFAPAGGCESIEAFEKKAKEAGYTFDGKHYETKKGDAEDYTVMVAAADTGSNNTTSIIIIVVTNAVLILIGVCLYLVGSKKK